MVIRKAKSKKSTKKAKAIKEAPVPDLDEIPDPKSVPEPEPIPDQTEKPDPKLEDEPKGPELGSVELRVFLAACGRKWDQMAGFARYAKTLKMAPRPMKAWKETYQVFMTRPVQSASRRRRRR